MKAQWEPKFKKGDEVIVKGNPAYRFKIAERRTVRSKSGYPRFEYREVWTWWAQKWLRKVKASA